MADPGIPLEETCIMCPRRGTKFCPTCKDACYCSQDCQKLDWKNHKIVCATFHDPKPRSSQAGINYRRGLLFPGGNEIPRLVWVETELDASPEYTFEQIDYDIYFDDMIAQHPCTHNSVQARDFVVKNEALVLHHKDTNVFDLPNLAIRNFTRGGSCAPLFRGPWLVMRQWKGFTPADLQQRKASVKEKSHSFGEYTMEGYRDINMRDVRSIADIFTAAWRSEGMVDSDKTVLMAATIHPPGEVTTVYGGKFSPYPIRADNSVFQDEGSGIANLIGIPVFVRELWGGQDATALGTQEATYLMRDLVATTNATNVVVESGDDDVDLMARLKLVDEKHVGRRSFGSSHASFENSKAGFLIARADGLPFLGEHLEALCGYLSSRVEPRLTNALKGLAPGFLVVDRESVLQSITQADFEDFFNTLKTEKSVRAEKWRMLPSPYEITRSFVRSLAPVLKFRLEEREEHLRRNPLTD